MFKRVTAVGTAPVLIIILMLLLAHLQPLDMLRMIGAEGVRTGRIVLDLLPFGLALLGLGIGIRFHIGGAMVAMLTMGSAYLALMLDGAGGTGGQTTPQDLGYTLPALLLSGCLLAGWAENVSWRSRRGQWALLIVGAGLVLFWTDQLQLLGMKLDLGARLESLFRPLNAASLRYMAGLAPFEINGGILNWSAAILFLVGAAWVRSPFLAGLGGSLVVTAPQWIQVSGAPPAGLAYAAAALMILVGGLEAVHKRAYRDALTDLPGRRSFDDTLRQLGRHYAIAMLDVDYFKRFNDRYGHNVGDEVLKMIAARSARIRGGRAFRYGGEEFAVVFAGRAAAGAEAAMEDFRRHLAQTPFVIRRQPRPKTRSRQGRPSRRRIPAARPKVKVTVSIGLARTAGRSTQPSDVLKAADKALYKAKRGGRNRTCRAT
ncbi:MAG: GGDEF domain-containing protein [Desulfobacterales bacterium]|nr:GGDEF domain-containing protein [Desulfobacterales bacterium]